ncbi:uncharacterized protein LOC119604691 [Lucilia sericata]|uniref:uncharacterized protein LOC119604691 n=1 Tax=Lucilia sericata TaxID=13632 RepID=UPI0018A86206|nr:uncharacterized protein LOC119604691 [Lucilia sericata]
MNVSIFQDANIRRIGVLAQPEYINVFVANALRFVIQNVFANITNDFVFTLSTGGGLVGFWFNDIMTKLFATWGFMAVQLVILDKRTKYMEVPGKRYCNMIVIDSFRSLEKTHIAEYNKNSDGLEYYFIFLQIRDKLLEREMQMIFRYCFDNYWIHCNIMVQTARGEIFIYTYFPFKENNCFQTQPEVINKFIGERFENDVMFPNKLRNFNKCPLKLTTWDIPPFVINGTGFQETDREINGFEIIIMIAISKKLNFTLDIDMISIDNYHMNQTPAIIPMRMLKNRETNITMGYFRRTALRDQLATPSYVTYYLPFVAVMLRRQTQFQSMGMLTFPFDKITWILIIVIYLLIVLMNWLNVKNRIVQNFQIHQVFMGMPIKNTPKESSKRVRLMVMLVTSFILRSVYQSLLFHLFRTHFYELPPVTLDGLVAQGYKAVCSAMSLNFIVNVPQIQDRSLPLYVIHSTNEMYPLYFLEVNQDQNFVAMSIFEFTLFYALGILSRHNALQILPINVNEQQIGFYFVKHSYLVDQFNNYILYFQQAGLLQKWKEWSNMEHLVSQQNGHSTSYENVFMVNLKQLLGFFYVVLMMHSVAFAVFALELLSKKIKWLQRIF